MKTVFLLLFLHMVAYSLALDYNIRVGDCDNEEKNWKHERVHEVITHNGSTGKNLEKNVTYTLKKKTLKITCIEVKNLILDHYHASVAITKGGIGHNSVQFHIRSQNGIGYQFGVHIFGK